MTVPSLQGRPLSPAEAWLAVAVLAAALFFFSRSKGAWAPLILLRGAAAALAALLLTGPVLTFLHRRTDAPVAVVLDASASMAALDGDRGHSSRWAAARSALLARAGALKGRAAPVFFRLDGGLKRDDVLEAPPRSPRSDFSKLSSAPSAVPGLKAVLFISDGRRGGGPDPRAALAGLGVPVHVVGVGNPAAAADAAVEDVRAAPFGFKNVAAEARVRLRFRALPPGRARLRVFSRGVSLGSAWVSRTDEDVIEATVPFRPSRAGAETFEVRLDAFPGEANVRNNALSFGMDVGRDRRRVLYICGRPGPNHAFLRQQLKTDPTVELVTFVILRDMEDLLTVPEQELSLIPFPAQAQLLEGLPSFDAVIFESFFFHRFGLGVPGMDALHRFVLDGGGFLVMGGEETFGPAGPYLGSPLEPLLPFSLDAPARGPSRYRAGPGAAHPFSPLEAGAGPEEWARLPELEGGGFFPGGLRAGAAPVLRAGSFPLAAVASAGKGRVMALDSLTTWRWALGGAPDAYVRFWSGALAWLTGEEEFRRVRLELPPSGAAPGEDVVIRVHARDDSLRPVPDGEARFVVVEADGSRRAGTLSPAGDGEYAGSFAPQSPGPARVEARVFRGGRLLGEASGSLSVGGSWDEGRDVTPDFALLEDIARSTGGSFTVMEGFTDRWVAEALEPLSWEAARRIPLGESTALAALLAVVLLAEWVLRRRRGVP